MSNPTNTASFIHLIAAHPYYLVAAMIAVPAIAILLATCGRRLFAFAAVAVIVGLGYGLVGGTTGILACLGVAFVAQALIRRSGEDTSTSIRPRSKIRYYVHLRNF